MERRRFSDEFKAKVDLFYKIRGHTRAWGMTPTELYFESSELRKAA